MGGNASPDWIELFLDYTDGVPSPKIFRQWAAISCVAGMLERRVWIQVSGKILFPNLYVLLVSRPGIGKTQAIDHVDEVWRAMKDLHVAPHDVTKASLVDAIANSNRKLILGENKLVEYSSLLVAADEFGVLVPSHDLDFLSTLNRLFDNKPFHDQNRRGFKEQIHIINPQINIIGGTQPAYLANLLPDEAWGMGFMSRVIMIYWSLKSKVTLFGSFKLDEKKYAELLSRAKKMIKLYGHMHWEYPAAEAADKWNDAGLEPVPDHSKLQHYNERRMMHVLKLSIISAISQDNDAITLSDFNRARDWLLEAEQKMPDTFREMVQRSDIDVIQELHFFAWQLYIRQKREIHEASLIHFLQNRVPSDKIYRILDSCVKANIFDKDAVTNMYRPRPKHEHGIE